MKQGFNKQEVLQALAVKKGLPIKLSAIQKEHAESLLKKRLTFSEALDIVEVLTFPYNAEMKNVAGRLSVLNMVADKAFKKLGIKDKDLDKLYTDSEKEFKEANERELKKFQEELKKAPKKHSEKRSKPSEKRSKTPKKESKGDK